MEKSTKPNNEKTINENIHLQNRKTISIEGIVEILSSNESEITALLKDTNLTILGSNIHIIKLDINEGSLSAEGNFHAIKYGKQLNFFKRIFKWKLAIFFKWKTF